TESDFLQSRYSVDGAWTLPGTPATSLGRSLLGATLFMVDSRLEKATLGVETPQLCAYLAAQLPGEWRAAFYVALMTWFELRAEVRCCAAVSRTTADPPACVCSLHRSLCLSAS